MYFRHTRPHDAYEITFFKTCNRVKAVGIFALTGFCVWKKFLDHNITNLLPMFQLVLINRNGGFQIIVRKNCFDRISQCTVILDTVDEKYNKR